MLYTSLFNCCLDTFFLNISCTLKALSNVDSFYIFFLKIWSICICYYCIVLHWTKLCTVSSSMPLLLIMPINSAMVTQCLFFSNCIWKIKHTFMNIINPGCKSLVYATIELWNIIVEKNIFNPLKYRDPLVVSFN